WDAMSVKRMRITGTLIMIVLSVPCLCVSLGCSGNPTAEVSGRVTLEGKPVPDGSITMVTEKEGRLQVASIKNGAYLMPRAPLGKVGATIIGRPIPPEQRPTPEGKAGYLKRKREEAEKIKRGEPVPEEKPPVDPFTLPGKYSNAATSGLTFEVAPG